MKKKHLHQIRIKLASFNSKVNVLNIQLGNCGLIPTPVAKSGALTAQLKC